MIYQISPTINPSGKQVREFFSNGRVKKDSTPFTSVSYFLPNTEGYQFSSQLLKGLKLENYLGYEDVQLATFEKIDNRQRHQHNRGWTPQINHMEDYRE